MLGKMNASRERTVARNRINEGDFVAFTWVRGELVLSIHPGVTKEQWWDIFLAANERTMKSELATEFASQAQAGAISGDRPAGDV